MPVLPIMLRVIHYIILGLPELTCCPPPDPSVVSQEQAFFFGSGYVGVIEYVLER